MKYLAFRRVDCYHTANGQIGIPTDFIIELSQEEHAALSKEFLFLPIVSNQEIGEAVEKAKQKAISNVKKQAEKAAKAKEIAAKRAATIAERKAKKEKALLEELKKKYV